MIVPENIIINGKAFIHSYSDKGMLIERDGEPYSDALDLAYLNRKYIETDKPIEGETDEATEADYQDALRDMGVSL